MENTNEGAAQAQGAGAQTTTPTPEEIMKDLGWDPNAGNEPPASQGGDQGGAPPASTGEGGSSSEGSSGTNTQKEITKDTILSDEDKFWADKGGEGGGNNSPATKTPEEYQKVMQENEQLKTIINDPFIKSLLAAKESGQNPIDFLTEGVKTPDPRNMSDEAVYKDLLRTRGLSEEEQEMMMDKWNEMDPLTRKEKIEEHKKSMTMARAKEAEAYAGEKFEGWDQFKRQEASNLSKTVENYQSLVDSLKGQKFLNVVEMNDEIVNDLKGAFDKGDIIPKKEDGTYDEAGILKMVMFQKYGGLIIENIAKTAAWKAYEKYVTENTVPTKQVQGSSSSSGGGTNLEEAVRADMEGGLRRS